MLTVERTTQASGVEVIRLSGTLTLGRDAESFERSFDGASARRVVIDMSGVSYVDSAGIGILVGSHSKIVNAGGQCRLAGVSDRVRHVFKLTKVDSILVLDDTAETASAAMA